MSNVSIMLSVIIPVLNNVKTIERTIKSVLEQEFKSKELIIIDGGSTDGTLEIIKKYNHHISFWCSEKDLGISDAFNKGVSRAKGDLIAILNSDDYWKKNTARIITSVALKNPKYCIYYGSIEFIDIATKKKYQKKPNIKHMNSRMSLFQPAIFVRKEVYKRVGMYSLKYNYAMDCEWLHRCINNNVSFYKINKVLACMSLGGKSDEFFIRSLNEYKRSLIDNQVSSKLSSNYSFIKYTILKLFTSNRFIRKIKQIILDNARRLN